MSWLNSPTDGCPYVVTPNVNHVVLHSRDARFRRAYEKASLVVADGRYLVAASMLSDAPLPGPVNGSDLVPAIFDKAEARGGLRVFLLGALPGVANDAASRIAQRWPWIDVVGVYSPPFGFEESDRESARMVQLVNRSKPNLLVLGISPPKQELWICAHATELTANAAICAGATIDVLANRRCRAPEWQQRIGAEWIYRCVHEPRRLLWRYVKDGVLFPRILAKELIGGRKRWS